MRCSAAPHSQIYSQSPKAVQRMLFPTPRPIFTLVSRNSTMYNFFVNQLSHSQLPPLQQRAPSSPTRVAYYLWHFPIPSETFIQREIQALQNAGLSLQVFADAPEAVQLFDYQAQPLMQQTHYLLPWNSQRLSQYRRRFFSNNPLLYLNLFLYTLGHRYSGYKNFQEDLRIFQTAIYLAGCLQDQHIHHLHSPWANVTAFIALLASRLAGIPYSVQARASADLYRTTARHALAEKFNNAKFILTNSQFNRSFIELYLNPRANVPIHVIYEGLDLSQFTPREKSQPANPIRILCVARLIEEKGVVYLLHALKLLQDARCSFHCEIVGAPDTPTSTYYQELQSLYRQLELQ